MCLNRPEIMPLPQSMEKLFSMKPVHSAKKVRDHCLKVQTLRHEPYTYLLFSPFLGLESGGAYSGGGPDLLFFNEMVEAAHWRWQNVKMEETWNLSIQYIGASIKSLNITLCIVWITGIWGFVLVEESIFQYKKSVKSAENLSNVGQWIQIIWAETCPLWWISLWRWGMWVALLELFLGGQLTPLFTVESAVSKHLSRIHSTPPFGWVIWPISKMIHITLNPKEGLFSFKI